jgi:hypothetical protein
MPGNFEAKFDVYPVSNFYNEFIILHIVIDNKMISKSSTFLFVKEALEKICARQ